MAFNISTFQSALAGGGARPSLFQFDVTGNPTGNAAGDFYNNFSSYFFKDVTRVSTRTLTNGFKIMTITHQPGLGFLFFYGWNVFRKGIVNGLT